MCGAVGKTAPFFLKRPLGKAPWRAGWIKDPCAHDIKGGAGLETWKGMSWQTVLTPPELATGKVMYPDEKAN